MSDLENALREIVERTEGARLAALIGTDGMTVARVGEADGISLDLVVASYADLVRRADRSADECGLAATRELVVGGDGGTVVVRSVTDGYGILALLEPGGSLGRLRYELHRAALALRDELDG